MRTNPVLSVDALEEPDRRLRWRRLQPEEVGAVAKAYDDLIAAETDKDERAWIEQARVVFLVVYGLGLRRGEVLGLRWRSIQLADPEHKPTLSVEQATVLGQDGPPKSATSRRTLVLDEFLAGELFDHRGRSRYQGDGERVFCHPLKGSTLDHKRYADTFRAALVEGGDRGLRSAVPRRPPLGDHERRRGRQLRSRGDEASRSLGLPGDAAVHGLGGRRVRRGSRAGSRSSLRPCASGKSSGNGRAPSRAQTQQGRQDSNLQPPVLETGALPIELRPWVARTSVASRGAASCALDPVCGDRDLARGPCGLRDPVGRAGDRDRHRGARSRSLDGRSVAQGMALN